MVIQAQILSVKLVGFLIKGTAAFITSGPDFEIIKGKFV